MAASDAGGRHDCAYWLENHRLAGQWPHLDKLSPGDLHLVRTLTLVGVVTPYEAVLE